MPEKEKKLTVKKTKEFFNLIKDENVDNSLLISGLISDFPQLSNAVVSGMAKGIDGYSALMLAIRFYNIKIAKILVISGANVNFIDNSDVRTYHYPILFDLIEVLRDFVVTKNHSKLHNTYQLWDLMDSHVLDYSIKSINNNPLTRPENCIQAFIRLVGAKYRNRHLVHNETKYDPPNPYINIFRFSEESRDKFMEDSFEKIAKRLIESTSIELIKELDANHCRWISGAILPFFLENGFVDLFSLTLVNRLVYEKYGFEIKNMHDTVYIKNYDEKLFLFENS